MARVNPVSTTTHLRLIAAYLIATVLLFGLPYACWRLFGALPPFSL